METNSKSKGGDYVTRHCAYCLNVSGSPTKLCGGCKKRAYCSKECQRADWSSKGNGQRHVNWCRRHECGEEDVDWEVVPIPNKGLGVRAKGLIPIGMKIIIEPAHTSQNGHPGIMDLEPKVGTLEDKFRKNNLDGDNVKQISVALRIARVNHACQPNAASIYDETAHVAILYALKDIQPGEEIAICYYSPFFDLLPYSRLDDLMIPEFKSIEEELNYFRKCLAFAHGIICPFNCFCYDPTILALVREGRQIRPRILELANENKIEEALAAGDKVLNIQRRLNVSWAVRADMEFNLFRLAVEKMETLPRAKQYIQSAVELFQNVCPYSENLTKRMEKLLEHTDWTGL